MSQVGVLPKQLNIGSRKQCRRDSNFLTPKILVNRQIEMKLVKLTFLTNILLYLRNGTIQRHSYYERLTGTHMHSIEWLLFLMKLSDPNYPNPPHFLILSCLLYVRYATRFYLWWVKILSLSVFELWIWRLLLVTIDIAFVATAHALYNVTYISGQFLPHIRNQWSRFHLCTF